MTAVVKLHQHGEQLAISTDASTEEEFLTALTPALADAVRQSHELGSDLEHRLDLWIPQIIDLACKLRGYKANVHEHRVLVAGQWLPDELVTAFSPLRFEKAG